MEFWEECISEAFEDAKIEATQEQIETVASWAEGAHENYGLSTGLDVASKNRSEELRDERIKLQKELVDERSKRGCPDCRGRGYTVENYYNRSSEHKCLTCNGEGKVL